MCHSGQNSSDHDLSMFKKKKTQVEADLNIHSIQSISKISFLLICHLNFLLGASGVLHPTPILLTCYHFTCCTGPFARQLRIAELFGHKIKHSYCSSKISHLHKLWDMAMAHEQQVELFDFKLMIELGQIRRVCICPASFLHTTALSHFSVWSVSLCMCAV